MTKMMLVTLVVLVAAAGHTLVLAATTPDLIQDSDFCAQIIEPYLLYNCTEYKV